jgi:3D (Asp-Asp-Asp) domain-containing protein
MVKFKIILAVVASLGGLVTAVNLTQDVQTAQMADTKPPMAAKAQVTDAKIALETYAAPAGPAVPAPKQEQAPAATPQAEQAAPAPEPTPEQQQVAQPAPQPAPQPQQQAAAQPQAQHQKQIASRSGSNLPSGTLSMVATAYGASNDTGKWAGLAYNGMKLRVGIVAVDPNVIPIGTKVRITGYNTPLLAPGGLTAIAADIGGKIKGHRIDIYLNGSHQQVSDFGMQNVRVEILK